MRRLTRRSRSVGAHTAMWCLSPFDKTHRFWNPVGMSAHAPTADTPLEAAATQIRNLCDERESLPTWIDSASVRRILVHIDNIGRAVTASMQDHVNAAKRLNDFAVVFARFAKKSPPPHEALAVRLISVSDNLRAASEELSHAAVTTESSANGHDDR
jgi:hypothetical protein